MKSSSDRKQEFNTTLFVAMTVAALLALGLLGLMYGCLMNNQASGNKPHAAVEQTVFSSYSCV